MFEMLIGKSSNVIEGPPGVEFLGEQSVTGFINGLQLASAIGLTAGTAQHSTQPWLHFTLDGKTLYVAKKPYRYSVSWNQINAVNAVSGSRTVIINGRTYKVRLLKSVASGNTYTGSNAYDPIETWGSEWNRLMYPIHSGNGTTVSGEGFYFGTLAQYTDTDLVVHRDAGNGARCWCQENLSSSSTTRVYRGNIGVSYLSWSAASTVSTYDGWRPVLELVG